MKKNLNVLILDDNPRRYFYDTFLLRRYLQKSVCFKAQLAAACSGKEELSLPEFSNFDSVLLAHRLPDGNSTAWLEALSARYPLFPFF